MTHSVAEFGAVSDGSETTTDALQATIDAVADAGGSTAHVPPGEYVTGTLELKDGVTLHVETGATLLGSTDRDDYGTDELTQDFFWDVEGREGWRDARAPLIIASGAEKIALTGGGRIDGRGANFWTVGEYGDEAGQRFLPDDRPGMMVRFSDCTGVRVRDVHIENSPGWTLHFRGCEDVLVHNARVHNSVYGPNTDGIDIDACRNVRVSDSEIMAGGDDAIVLKNVLKALREYPERPSRNITVTNCDLVSTTNGFKIGTENYGGFEQVTLSNSVIRAPVAGADYSVDNRFGQATGPYGGISLEMVDGAILDGVTVSNVVMQGVQAPVFLRAGNRPRYRRDHPKLPDRETPEPGRIRNVSISDIVAVDAIRPSPLVGLPDAPLENVSLTNVRIETAGGKTDPDLPARDVPEGADDYPEATQWGALPAFGLYCRHIDGLTVGTISIDVADEDVRPMAIFDDATDLRIDGVVSDAPVGDRPLFRLIDARRALLRGLAAPKDAETVVAVEGSDSHRVTVASSDLRAVTDPIRIADDVPEETIQFD